MSKKPDSPPRCPKCGSKSQHAGPDLFRCVKAECLALFDRDPNEGGDYSDRNPAARLERAERSKFNKRQ